MVAAESNSPAIGAPAITSTAQAGETLTAGKPGIEGADGLTNATFNYQWLADDQWRRLRSILPAREPRTGRLDRKHCTVINVILRSFRTALPWRDPFKRLGP